MTDWFFKDKAGKVQGPFGTEEMRAWYEAGYLSAELPVARGDPRSNPFKALADHFPNGGSAFLESSSGSVVSGGGDTGGQWYFLDKNHKQQGPFTDIHMRQWHMAGYFEPTLLIIDVTNPNPEWSALSDFFPNIADAFAIAGPMTSAGRRQAGGGGGGGGGPAPPGGSVASSQGASRQPAARPGEDPRFSFPDWLPVPPRYRGVKKVYPSEKNGGKRRVAIRDVHGQQVDTLQPSR